MESILSVFLFLASFFPLSGTLWLYEAIKFYVFYIEACVLENELIYEFELKELSVQGPKIH